MHAVGVSFPIIIFKILGGLGAVAPRSAVLYAVLRFASVALSLGFKFGNYCSDLAVLYMVALVAVSRE